tara:strand:+ start:9606 stop:10766 length:1161 start_codon:yes stop_codon:yes gene_type:complete
MNKYIYPFNLIITFAHFLIIFYASKVSTYEVGIYSFINAILGILIPTATFEGTNHYISKLITKNELESWSKSTNTILTIVLISIGTSLFLYSNLLALSLILINCINLYINWSLALEEPELRLKKGYNNIFKKNSFINQLFFRFLLQFFLIIILGLGYQNNLLLKFFILLEILIFSRISFIKIGVIKNPLKNKLPPIKYFLNVLLDKIEGSILIFAVSFISGFDTLGNLQLGLTISKSFQILTKPFIRFEYVNLYSKSFLKKAINYSFFSYVVYLLFPLILLFLENYFQILNYSLNPFIFILICLYSGNDNSKELIKGIYLVLGDLRKNIKFKVFLILINLFIFVIQIILKNILPFSLILIIIPFIFSDLFFTLNQLKKCKKINDSR